MGSLHRSECWQTLEDEYPFPVSDAARDATSTPTTTSSCYLETPSDPSLTFQISCYKPKRSRSAKRDVRLKLSVDGRYVPGKILGKEWFGKVSRRHIYSKIREQIHISELSFFNIVFADIDANPVQGNGTRQHLGIIEVTLQSGTAGTPYIGLQDRFTDLTVGAVPEKLMKNGLDMTITGTNHVLAQPETFVSFKKDGRFDQRFIFKYCSRAALMVRGVIRETVPPIEASLAIDRDPHPVPEPQDKGSVKVELANEEDEIAALEARLDELRARKRVKLERPARPPIQPGEFIDLSLD